jgi:cytochrome c-type biogenesis protein CcmH
MKRARLALVFALTIAASLAHAVQLDEMLRDPTLEARARALSAELRCMVCQNQSIDDSDAPLARDIRLLIRDRIAKGESNEGVRDFLASRYGDFILLNPPFKLETLLLWAGAPLAALFGALALWRAARRKDAPTPALSEAEEARLAAIAGEGGEGARLPTRDDPAMPAMERPRLVPLRHREGAQRRSDPD